MSPLRFLRCSALLAAGFFGSVVPVFAAQRIVFLAGGRSHGPGEHEFNAGCRILAKALNEQSGLAVQATVVNGWPADEGVLDGAKAVVIYADGSSVVGKGWEKMDALAGKGVGIMFMHYAVHPSAEQGEKYFRPWIGGAFETGWSVNPHWVADLKGLPNHAVSRGVKGLVEAYDEFYYHMRFPAERGRVLDLVTATPTRERIKRYINLWNEHGVSELEKPQALMWGIERQGGGRGVGFTGGHYHRNWAVDGFRTLVLNAVVWAAGMEVPADGVRSLPVGEEQLNENLDDKGPSKARLTVPQPGEFKAIPTAPVPVEREKGFGAKVEGGEAKTIAVSGKAAVSVQSSAKPEEKGVAKPVYGSPQIKSGTRPRFVDVKVALDKPRELYLVVSDEGSISCDWADWIEPRLVMADGRKLPLTDVKWKSATAGSGRAMVGKNSMGGPLLVEGKGYGGIGTHAPSVIAYELPEGVVGFEAQAGIDDGGMERGGKPSDACVKFQVFTQKPPTAAAAAPVVVKDDGETLVPANLFTVPEGLEVSVWATSPMLYNPTNIAFDERGRLWVAEGVNYRGKRGRRPEGDRIVVLEDSTGAGKADRSTVFVQEAGLASPLGVAVFEDKVVVSQPPDLLVYSDTNGNGVFEAGAEKREVLLTGFGGNQHDHSLHSVTAGPDGQWYWNQGNTGAHFTDRSGREFFMGSPYMMQEIAGRKSGDGHVWIGGFLARMNPDGTGVTVLGHNFRNSYEQAVTSFGDVFQSDNDDPPACRVTPVMEGGNAGFASVDGKRAWGADRRPGQETPVAEWRQEDPGTMPAGDVYGGGSPTGVAFYENGALGEKWNGLLLACEAGKNVVFGYLPKPEGAGWRMERFDFLTSNKEKEFAGSDFLGGKASGELKTKFRPSDVAVGPDGALYVADWFDARVGGHGTMDDRYTGTIYRIAPKGFRSQVPKLDLGTQEGQIAALRSPAVNVRYSGFVRLKAQGAAAVPAVSGLLADGNPYIAARAAWLLAQMGDAGAAKVRPWLEAGEEWKRVVAYRALRRAGADVLGMAGRMAEDKSAAVRREVALTLREVEAGKAVPILKGLAGKFDGKDRAYLEALGLGSEGKEAAVYEALRGGFGAPGQWGDAAAWVAWRLHPAGAVAAFRERALSGELSREARKLMVDGLAFVGHPSAVGAMIELARAKGFPLKDQADWWLMNRKGNLWKEYGVEQSMQALGMYDPAKVKLMAVEMPPVPKDAPQLPGAPEIAKLAGDAVRGKAAVAVCHACHKIGGQGVEYGPDLTTFARQQTAEVVIQAILKPSQDISHGYEGSLVKTTDGLNITGMVLSDGDPLLVKCMGNMVQTVPRSRVASVAPLGRSLMYEPSQLGLNAQAIADIVAYLRTP